MAALVGTEIIYVNPLLFNGMPAPIAEQTTTGAIAALALPVSSFGPLFVAWFNSLPTTLPSQPGQPWNNGQTVAIS